MTGDEMRAKWSQRQAEYRLVGAQVSGELVAREVLADLEQLERAGDSSVTLQEAAAIGGYSIDHLQRLVASGAIGNVGRKGKPRIRRADIPRKPGFASLRDAASDPHLSDRRRVVTSVIARRNS